MEYVPPRRELKCRASHVDQRCEMKRCGSNRFAIPSCIVVVLQNTLEHGRINSVVTNNQSAGRIE